MYSTHYTQSRRTRKSVGEDKREFHDVEPDDDISFYANSGNEVPNGSHVVFSLPRVKIWVAL